MVTLQEYLDQKYPTKEDKEKVKEIASHKICGERKSQGITKLLKGGKLDLRGFVNIEEVLLHEDSLRTPITELYLGTCANLSKLCCQCNKLTSVDFLNQLSCPEELKVLQLFNNNIESTDIKIFSRFTNLKSLKIGTMEKGLNAGKHNRFYGSFESWKNLTKLTSICIELTDVSEGLEYLPFSLAQSTKEWLEKSGTKSGYFKIECSSHNTNTKCKLIQDALRPYDYDLEAWQLAHPELMRKAKLELSAISNNKWIQKLDEKIEETQEKLEQTKSIEGKEKKICRIETTFNELKLTKEVIERSTQTDLTGKEIEELIEFRKQIQAIAKK
jgi:hypothetical protein